MALQQGKSASQLVISLPGGVPVRVTVFTSTVCFVACHHHHNHSSSTTKQQQCSASLL